MTSTAKRMNADSINTHYAATHMALIEPISSRHVYCYDGNTTSIS